MVCHLQFGLVTHRFLEWAGGTDLNMREGMSKALPMTCEDLVRCVGPTIRREGVGQGDVEWMDTMADLTACNPNLTAPNLEYQVLPCDQICVGPGCQ